MSESTTGGTSASDPNPWTLVFDDGTIDGLRVACTEERVVEYILAHKATASTSVIAAGSTERVPLGQVPRFAPLFNGSELDALTRIQGTRLAASLRTLATLCKVCAYVFLVLGVVWLCAAIAGAVSTDGRRGFAGMLITGLIGLAPLAAIPLALFTLSAIAEGVAALLDQNALRRFRAA